LVTEAIEAMRGLKIAVVGKGGVGKTTIAGTLACLLSRRGFKVLAVDADPNANLAYTLGLKAEEADKIIPISENWSLIEEKTGVSPESYGGVFRLSFTVDDIIARYAVKTPCGVNLLVMGVVRSAAQGCMCPANALIRSLLRHILVRMNEVVVADMEAGTEHLGRGTAKHVDYMLVIVEPTLKSLKTAQHIRELALDLGVKTILLVGNKVMDKRDEVVIRGFAEKNGFQLIGMVPYDPEVKEAELTGTPIIFKSPSSRAVCAIEEVCNHLIGSEKA